MPRISLEALEVKEEAKDSVEEAKGSVDSVAMVEARASVVEAREREEAAEAWIASFAAVLTLPVNAQMVAAKAKAKARRVAVAVFALTSATKARVNSVIIADSHMIFEMSNARLGLIVTLAMRVD